MLKKISENKGLIFTILVGLSLACIIIYVIFESNQTIKVWVPNKSINQGTIVTQDMIHQIDVSKNTPGNIVKDKDLIVSFKLRNKVEKDQFFYPNDFLSSIESYNKDINVPDDFIITSIQIPDDRAVGGLIVPGDIIDVFGVSKDGRRIGFEENATINGRDNIGVYIYPIIANVKVISTNSAMAQAQNSDVASIMGTDASNNNGTHYVVALSYENLKKLRQSEGMLELWINIAPKQNEENKPLLGQMIGQSWSGLHDAQEQVAYEDGTPISGVNQFTPGEGTPGGSSTIEKTDESSKNEEMQEWLNKFSEGIKELEEKPVDKK